jgi:hypothetical protein
VTVRQHYGLGPEDEATAPVCEHILPVVERSPGFGAFFAFMNAQHRGQSVGVTLFDCWEEAARSNERVVAAMLEKGIAPYPPKVTAGKALVMAVAESAPPEFAESPAR